MEVLFQPSFPNFVASGKYKIVIGYWPKELTKIENRVCEGGPKIVQYLHNVVQNEVALCTQDINHWKTGKFLFLIYLPVIDNGGENDQKVMKRLIDHAVSFGMLKPGESFKHFDLKSNYDLRHMLDIN